LDLNKRFVVVCYSLDKCLYFYNDHLYLLKISWLETIYNDLNKDFILIFL